VTEFVFLGPEVRHVIVSGIAFRTTVLSSRGTCTPIGGKRVLQLKDVGKTTDRDFRAQLCLGANTWESVDSDGHLLTGALTDPKGTQRRFDATLQPASLTTLRDAFEAWAAVQSDGFVFGDFDEPPLIRIRQSKSRTKVALLLKGRTTFFAGGEERPGTYIIKARGRRAEE